MTRTTRTFGLLMAVVAAAACSASGAGSGNTAGSTTGGLTAGGTSGGSANCAGNQLACGGGCVDPQSDPQNCGACGAACSTGQACAGGSCVATCTGANGTLCGANCVDLATDEANCGSCGHACPSGQGCANSACAATGCNSPLTACGGGELPNCVNLQNDTQDCGSCGNVCPGGQTCSSGKCQGCAGGQILCSGSCTNTQTDGNNCGSCGTVCTAGLACTAGQCSSCSAGEVSCGGACTNPVSDSNNCGGCADAGGHVCSSAQACQTAVCVEVCNADAGLSACGSGTDLACVDLGTDPSNCGTCGHGCGAALGCDGGICSCGAGQSLCGSGAGAACFYTTNDPLNCGACGHVCSSQLCHSGNCLYCPAGSMGFTALVLVDAGVAPGYVGIADFNGDGRPDLAAANIDPTDGTLGIILGLDGGLAPQASFNAGLDSAILAIADVNHDGRPDVATLSNSNDSFSLLLDETPDGGAATFTLQGPFECQATQYAVTLAIVDANGDGLPDVVVGGTGITLSPPGFGGTLDVFLQSDAGFPAASTSSVVVGQSVSALATVQLGLDAGPALATVDSTGNAVFVLEAAGLFSSQTSYAVGNLPVSIAVGDLNGDGTQDLAVLNQGDDTVTVLLGQNNGTFTAESPVAVSSSSGLGGFTLIPQWVTLGDVNGDGVPDLIVSVSDQIPLQDDVVNYLINQGNATFASPVSVPAAGSGFSPYSVAVRDLNGDGLPDLALGNLGSGDFVGVLYGKCP